MNPEELAIRTEAIEVVLTRNKFLVIYDDEDNKGVILGCGISEENTIRCLLKTARELVEKISPEEPTS